MPKSLLLADDSITIQKVVQITFASEDFQITAVDNGDAALEKIRQSRPHIVLADVVMPGKTGYDICQVLKSDPTTKSIPVILLAGTFEPFDQERAKAVGADDFIVKPFETQALIDKVKRLTAGMEGSAAAAPSAPAPAAATAPAKPASPFAPPASSPFAAKPLAPPAPAAAPPPAAAPAKPAAAPSPFAALSSMPPLGAAPKPAAAPPAAVPTKDPFGMGQGYAAPKPAAPSPAAPAKPAGNWNMDSFAEMPTDDDQSLPEIEVSPMEPEPAAKPAPAPAAPAPRAASPAAAPAPANEAALRSQVEGSIREIIEKIVWEIVPELAETIIREELEKLLREKS
jgi:CheY-like chemotaxis protein